MKEPKALCMKDVASRCQSHCRLVNGTARLEYVHIAENSEIVILDIYLTGLTFICLYMLFKCQSFTIMPDWCFPLWLNTASEMSKYIIYTKATYKK